MWRTSSLTCRAVFLAVLCGSAASARAGIIVFQSIEAPKFIGPAAKPLSLAATETAGHVSFAFPNDLAPELIIDFPAGATLGRGGVLDRAVNPAEHLQVGFSPESSFDGLLPSLHTGMGDPGAGVRVLPGEVPGERLVGTAEGQTGDESVRRAPVPGALFLSVFGLGVAGLGWRRFA